MCSCILPKWLKKSVAKYHRWSYPSNALYSSAFIWLISRKFIRCMINIKLHLFSTLMRHRVWIFNILSLHHYWTPSFVFQIKMPRNQPVMSILAMNGFSELLSPNNRRWGRTSNKMITLSVVYDRHKLCILTNSYWVVILCISMPVKLDQVLNWSKSYKLI